MKIAPSILSADFANLQTDIERVEKGGADYIHVDVMDGQFVPNITFGSNVVQAIRPVTKLPLDVHLMIINPENYIADFAKARFRYHYGPCGIDTTYPSCDPDDQRFRCQSEGSLSILVHRSEMIKHVLPLVDQVLVMTVNPGFGGQSFITETVDKIAELAELRKGERWTYQIEVDGGIVPETAKNLS